MTDKEKDLLVFVKFGYISIVMIENSYPVFILHADAAVADIGNLHYASCTWVISSLTLAMLATLISFSTSISISFTPEV